MNEPAQPSPSTPPAPPSPPPPLPQAPLAPESGLIPVVEALLKRPATLIAALQQARSARHAMWLAIFAVLALLAYGLVVGSFSGGRQFLAAPLKISLGALASLLICLPSLFIFACLTGADVSLRGVFGVACATLSLAAMLLIGFAPVAWVFSQSTNSVAFIGALHLTFWLIAVGFGLRLLRILMDHLRVSDRAHLKVWAIIFVLVSLQMTTALRPIIGTSTDLFPKEKKFFVAHWIESISDDAETADRD